MIYRSRVGDVEVPDVTLNDHVLRRADQLGDKVAVVDAAGGEAITYRQLGEQVAATAGALAAMGVGEGDAVALLSHNQPRYAVALHGALAAGAVVAPINPVLTPAEVGRILTMARATVVVTSGEAAATAAEAADAAGVRHRFVLGDHELGDIGFAPFAALAESGQEPPQLAVDPATAIAALPFSSGTTGLPKGVMLSHRNLVANIVQNGACCPVGPDDVLAAALPFFHIYGFTIILNTGLAAGATVVTMPRFDLGGYLRMVEEHRVTRAYLAPPMVLGLAAAPDVESFDLGSLRYTLCGAAPLDAEAARRAEERLGCLIRQGYGMTEAAPGTHIVADADAATTPLESVGGLLPSTEARLVDPATGEDAAPGEAGELWVRGPQVMLGYLDDPAATAATMVDGSWLRTGDLVRVSGDDVGGDGDAVFWVVDRLKELIKYKGYQVPPAELEAVLLGHPAVADAAVVGVPHATGGEAPKAFVVAAGPLDAEELMAWVAQRVAPYKKVREVELVDVVPRSPSGKILRRVLKAQSQEREAES